MNENNTIEITSRETVPAGATAFRPYAHPSTRGKLDGMIENWAELRTMSDAANETQTLLDTEHQVTGFASVETRNTVMSDGEIRFGHSVEIQNHVKVTSTARDSWVNVKIRTDGAFGGDAPWSEIKVRGSEQTMRRLAESILAALDGDDA